MMARTIAIVSAMTAMIMAATAPSFAQPYPTKPIVLVNPYPPGASVDQIARLLQPKLEKVLGQPIVIENKPGASGNIGTRYVASAEPDGYTLLISTSAIMSLNPHVFKNIGFNPQTDFAPIATAVNGIITVTINKSLPVNTLRELINYSAKNPEKVFFGTTGVGSPQYLAGELLNKLGRVKMLHVPYKGGGEAMKDLLGGQIQVVFSTLSGVLEQYRSGNVKILAIGESERFSGEPNIPTIAETFPGTVITTWYAFFAPRGTPESIVARLNGAIVEVLNQPDTKKMLTDLSLTVIADKPEQLGALLKSDIERWGPFLKELGVEEQ